MQNDECGSMPGYRAHLAAGEDTCQACRDAQARYQRGLELDHLKGQPRRVPVLGSKRRLQALRALGWSCPAIARHLGFNTAVVQRIFNHADDVLIHRSTALKVRKAYDDLSMRLPTSTTYAERIAITRTRNLAKSQGWLPPLALDDDRIDDPAYTPTSERVRAKSHDEVDEAVVVRILDGEKLPATRAEREEVMRRWVKSGGAAVTLARRMGWHDARYRTSGVAS